jgi:hypothetical protein
VWAGFNSSFHSSRIAADGTSNAAVGLPRIHSSPNRCRDSSLVSCQRAGRVFTSSLPVSTASGMLPSIDTRSAGLNSRMFQPRRAPAKLRHRRRAPLGCSIVPRRVESLPHSQPPQRSGGIFSRTALAVYAICDAAQDVFDHARAQVGIELIQRSFATQRAVRGGEPSNGFIPVADHLDGMCIYSRHADRAIGFRWRQQGRFAQTPSQRTLRNAQLP